LTSQRHQSSFSSMESLVTLCKLRKYIFGNCTLVTNRKDGNHLGEADRATPADESAEHPDTASKRLANFRFHGLPCHALLGEERSVTDRLRVDTTLTINGRGENLPH